ncbi:MAG: hypothetical protein ACP5G1_00270 [Nanopusillaceae archaeon]
MVLQDKLKKEFAFFCKISGGNFKEGLYFECERENYSIKVGYNGNNLSLTISSKLTGDYEVLSINNVKVMDVERLSKENDLREIEYYVLNIYLDKGILSIRKSSRENKLVINLKTSEIEYESSVLF